MQFEEKVNLRDVHYLNSLSFETYKNFTHQFCSSTYTKPPSNKDIRVLYDNLKQYCKTMIKTKGVFKRIYSHSINTSAGGGGRLFSGGSLQGMTNIFRSVIFRGIDATDIDQCNSHPTILRFICKNHNINCPHLEYYINNRDRCLQEFASRDEGKKAFLVATNTDKRVKTHSNFLKQYDAEMKHIQKSIIELQDYKHIISSMDTEKVNYNGSAMNKVLCYFENIILQHAIDLINSKNIEIAVLMFDGLVIYGNYYNNPSLLQEITTYVNSKMHELNMTWCYKPFNRFITVPDEFDMNTYEGKVSFRAVSCEDEASNLIYQELKDRLIPAKKRIFFKQNNIWIDDINEINDFLLEYIMSSNITKRNEKNEYQPYAQNVKTAKNIRETVLVKIKNNYVGYDLYEKFHSTTKGRLAFEDGVLDFKTKIIYDWDDLPFEFYSTKIIPRKIKNWLDNPNMTVVNDIKTKIFEMLFGNDITQAVQFLSRAIAGHVEDKNFATYLGSRDCGKGVIFELLKNAFGDYIRSFELGNMLYERASKSTETSRMMYWLLDYEFVRIAISQETPEPSRGLKVNSELLKRICGGGDEQTARRNYDRVDTQFKLDSSFFMMGNYSLNFDSNDVMEHCLEFNSTIQFKSKRELDAMVKSGESELLMSSYRVRDDQIKDLCKTNDWINACVWLLLNNYVDEAVPCFKVNDDEDEMSVRKKLLETYEITRNEEHFIPVCDVVSYIGGCKKKITNELQSFGVLKKKNKYRGDMRDKSCFFGLKAKKRCEDGDL